MCEDMFEIAKKNITKFTFGTAEIFIRNLARSRRISFPQYRELNRINREAN